jgi:hypothetical protein
MMKKKVKVTVPKKMVHKAKGNASDKVKPSSKPTGIPKMRKGYAK